MKITLGQLRRIIREQIEDQLNDQLPAPPEEIQLNKDGWLAGMDDEELDDEESDYDEEPDYDEDDKISPRQRDSMQDDYDDNIYGGRY